MSLTKQDLQDQLQAYRTQRQQACVALQNLDGAIAAIEHQVKMVVEREAELLKEEADKIAADVKKIEDQMNLEDLADMKMDMEIQQGESQDGGTVNESAE